MSNKTRRNKFDARWSALKNERSSWDAHCKEISTYLTPRAGRFFTSDRNRGDKRHNSIYDNTGIRALRVLAAGMMSGMTSPARPWFRLATADAELMKYAPVKQWLNNVTTLMHRIFQRSNTYRALHSIYEELGSFGTGASIVVPDYKNIIHHHPQTFGQYAIATNDKGEVDTLYREFEMTVAAMVKEFGINKLSETAKRLHGNGNLDAWVPVIHVIEPRIDRDPRKRDGTSMPWRSLYFEPGSDEGKYLRDGGFKRFRALCPRWSTSGGDIYGTSPGMEALGDIKQLQHEQLRKGESIDYGTKPPLAVPSALKEIGVNRLPGGVTFTDAVSQGGGIRSLFEVNLDLSHLLEDIHDVRGRINGAFYADLFLMLANQVDTRMTATEVAERHEEKLLMLGPVLERLQNELLDPLIEITFDEIMSAGLLPPPPQELQGHDINVELVSMLAQAQRAIGTNSIDRFVGNLGAVAQFKPDVLDKVDADKWVDIYSDALGIDPNLIVPDDQVRQIRQQRAQRQQQMEEAALQNQGADTAAKLGGIDTGKQNALTDITRQFSGYT